MYVLRSLIDEDIPLNQGVLAPVEIVMPEGLLNPRPSRDRGGMPGRGRRQRRDLAARGRRAVRRAGPGRGQPGDDEQPAVRRRDVRLLRNDLRRRGRNAEADGADAVHTHMTNTRLTDPEVLERRYPVRVRSFSIRRGSGGAGGKRGGDGVVRKLEFLQAAGSLDPLPAPRPVPALRPRRRPARRRWAATRSTAPTARGKNLAAGAQFQVAGGRRADRSKRPAAADGDRREPMDSASTRGGHVHGVVGGGIIATAAGGDDDQDQADDHQRGGQKRGQLSRPDPQCSAKCGFSNSGTPTIGPTIRASDDDALADAQDSALLRRIAPPRQQRVERRRDEREAADHDRQRREQQRHRRVRRRQCQQHEAGDLDQRADRWPSGSR